MHLGAVIQQVWRYTSRPRSSKCGDCNHVSLKMLMVAVMVWPWRPWYSEAGLLHGGSQWRVHRVLGMYWSINKHASVGLWQDDCTCELWWRARVMAGVCVGMQSGNRSYTQGSTRNNENDGNTSYVRWMSNWVYAVLGVCWTKCMLWSVYVVLSIHCTCSMLCSHISKKHFRPGGIGDAAKISPHVPSTLSSRSVGRRSEDMILPACKDPRNCADPRNLGNSEWDQRFGKIECVFSLYDKMRWKWDAVYLSTPGYPKYILCVAHSTSVTPVSLYTHHHSLTIYLEAVIELVWRCIWRPRSIEMRDTLGGRHQSNWELYLEAVIELVWRCTWRPRSSELRDTLGSRDQSSLEMHWEAEVEWTQRCTLRPWSSEFGDALGGRDRVNGEMHLEAVIDRTENCTWRPWSS